MGQLFDEDTQQIYIADFVNRQAQIMSLQGKFITSFGQDVLELPYGISVNKDHIIVTKGIGFINSPTCGNKVRRKLTIINKRRKFRFHFAEQFLFKFGATK